MVILNYVMSLFSYRISYSIEFYINSILFRISTNCSSKKCSKEKLHGGHILVHLYVVYLFRYLLMSW